MTTIAETDKAPSTAQKTHDKAEWFRDRGYYDSVTVIDEEKGLIRLEYIDTNFGRGPNVPRSMTVRVA